jgi:2-haloacid dehalogenase
MDLTKYEALSFDCYGTLIDWEAGLLGVLRPWATECGLEVDDDYLLRTYGDHESAAEREQPSSLYPSILAETFRRTGRSLGIAADETRAARFGDSVPDWPAFPDSSAALAALAQHYRLIIVSNVHRAGFAASNSRLRRHDQPGRGATPEPGEEYSYSLEFSSMEDFATVVETAFAAVGAS